MRIGVFGTGMVGETIGSKLVELGHEVMMGSRTANNEKAAQWVARFARGASQGTFADAARFGELLFNCTSGAASLAVLAAAGKENLSGKTLVDVSNPLDTSRGMPPTLFVAIDDSLGERIQRAFPELRVVKTLNTVNCSVMADASVVPGEHTVFVCGNDAAAKADVEKLLRSGFGHRDVIDLGDITGARATEAIMPIWLKLWKTLGTGNFNVKVVR